MLSAKTKVPGRWPVIAVLGVVVGLSVTLNGCTPKSVGVVRSALSSENPAALGRVSSLAYRDLDGKQYGLDSLVAHKAIVFLFVSCQCPISNVYTPRFLSLAQAYVSKGVQVVAVYSDRQESRDAVAAHAKTHGITFPVVKDDGNALADQLGATYTPQAVIVDAQGAIRYRGRIDDNAIATRVTTHDLTGALDAVLADKPVAHLEVAAFGCAIRRVRDDTVTPAGTPTYARNVAPILRAKCEGCHRPGEVAPFTLQTYEQASAWAADIKRYTQNGQMPPWKPTPGYGHFTTEHERTLTDQERATLAKWADGGAPLGESKQIPPPRQFSSGWQLGNPDLIIAPEREYHVTADGEDVYRNFVIKMDTSKDRWVRAVEMRPGNRAVVHHAVGYVDVSGKADQLEAATHDGEPGYTSFGTSGFIPRSFLGNWVPGAEPVPMPDGVAVKLPKGCRVVIQIHYHKDGKPETDKTLVGLYFARTKVRKELYYPLVLNYKFRIPPGADNYEVRASTKITEASHLYTINPHMHLLGKDMKLWAQLPGHKEQQPLIWITNWDFNWQNSYPLQPSMPLPAGTIIYAVAHYDNSANNPRNPNRLHLREVIPGVSTTDEMCTCLMTATRDAEHLNVAP